MALDALSTVQPDAQRPILGMDWISDPSTLSEHLSFIRSVDWGLSKIGLPSSWPIQLHQTIDMCLADPTPAAVMWGEDLTV
jgi:hypothetical protein